MSISCKSSDDHLVTINYLVMRHVCENLMPNMSSSQAVESSSLKDLLSSWTTDYWGDEKAYSSFLDAIGVKSDKAALLDVRAKLIEWWELYSERSKSEGVFHSEINHTFMAYHSRKPGVLCSDVENYERLDNLIRLLCGEKFCDIYEKIVSNPFLDNATNGGNPNVYSVSVRICRQEYYCFQGHADVPAKIHEVPLQMVSKNLQFIGSNLLELAGRTAQSLVDAGISENHFVDSLIIMKNGVEFFKLPLEVRSTWSGKPEDPIPTGCHDANACWRKYYALNFRKVKVVRRDVSLMEGIAKGMSSHDRLQFLTGHFGSELGL